MVAGTLTLMLTVGGSVAGAVTMLTDGDQPHSITTATGTESAGPEPAGTGPAGTGLTGTGLAGTGPTGTGPAGTGPAGTGPAAAPQDQVAMPPRTGQMPGPATTTATAKLGAVAPPAEKHPAERQPPQAVQRPAEKRPVAVAPPKIQAQPRAAPKPPQAAARPVIVTRTEVQSQRIPYGTRTVRDSSLPDGTRLVQSPGVAGVRTLRFLATYRDGRLTSRRLVGSTVVRAPQHEVVALGNGGDDSGPSDDQDQSDNCGPFSFFCFGWGRRATCPEDASVTVAGNRVQVLGRDPEAASGSC